MLVVRYFLYVGGVLLALLFVSDAYFPKSPVVQTADSDLPVIRIHSDRKLPDRVVFDTSRPTVVAPQTLAVAAAQPPATAPEFSAKARVRETFAQFVPPEPKKPDPKPQRKRKIAQRRAAPPMMLVAQQPQFGLFGGGPWRSTW
jgi:hypothetical protein